MRVQKYAGFNKVRGRYAYIEHEGTRRVRFNKIRGYEEGTF